jgi:hypothetical protein
VVSNTYCVLFLFFVVVFFFVFCTLCCRLCVCVQTQYVLDTTICTQTQSRQRRVQKTKKKTTTKNKNRTQYVLDTTICTQAQSRQRRVAGFVLCADSGVQHILCSVFVFCCCFFSLSSVPYVAGFVFVCR